MKHTIIYNDGSEESIDFNQQWAVSHTKTQFVDEHMPHNHIYPGLKNKDKQSALEAAWKKLRNEPDEVVDGLPVVADVETTPA